MKAMDVMVRDVVTVKPDDSVSEVVKLLAEHDVSALPVVNADGQVVGMISEADLMRVVDRGDHPSRNAGRGLCQIAWPACRRDHVKACHIRERGHLARRYRHLARAPSNQTD